MTAETQATTSHASLLRMSLAWKRTDVQRRGHDGPLGFIAEHACLAAMPNPTTTCGICGSAAVVTGTDGTIRRRASELPSPIIIVTIECPKCGLRQQPEKPNYCDAGRPTSKQSVDDAPVLRRGLCRDYS